MIDMVFCFLFLLLKLLLKSHHAFFESVIDKTQNVFYLITEHSVFIKYHLNKLN